MGVIAQDNMNLDMSVVMAISVTLPNYRDYPGEWRAPRTVGTLKKKPLAKSFLWCRILI